MTPVGPWKGFSCYKIPWSRDGKPYPHSCCSWKVTYFNKSFFLGSLIGNQQRYEVKTLGPNSSALIIRDYQSNRDDGIYRCFATRSEGAMTEFRGFKTMDT